ncbi:MAG: hypothetical protein LBI06_04435 [Treponema sp.]|jgi:hypothetical protein|nr:hypothetical protein [Treponema sp.]
MKKVFLFFIISAAALQPIFASSLEDLVGADRAAILRTATGPITGLQQRTLTPRLLPRHEGLGRFINEVQSSLDPNLFVESISLYRKPPSGSWSEAEQIGLLNQLTALSTLTGIQYYSESRKAMRVFYESSQVVDDPVAKNPLPDPVFNTLPASIMLYTRQKDLTFGDNVYQYSYRTGADAIFFAQENLTSMNTGIIPAIGRNKFRSIVAVIDAGDTLLVYAAAMAKTASVPGMGDRIAASFTNRVNAIFQWFTGRADRVFKVS